MEAVPVAKNEGFSQGETSLHRAQKAATELYELVDAMIDAHPDLKMLRSSALLTEGSSQGQGEESCKKGATIARELSTLVTARIADCRDHLGELSPTAARDMMAIVAAMNGTKCELMPEPCSPWVAGRTPEVC